MFCKIIKIFLLLTIWKPVINKLKLIKIETKPKDWKNKSEMRLPLIPKKFFIIVFLGKMKFGSSGE